MGPLYGFLTTLGLVFVRELQTALQQERSTEKYSKLSSDSRVFHCKVRDWFDKEVMATPSVLRLVQMEAKADLQRTLQRRREWSNVWRHWDVEKMRILKHKNLNLHGPGPVWDLTSNLLTSSIWESRALQKGTMRTELVLHYSRCSGNFGNVVHNLEITFYIFDQFIKIYPPSAFIAGFIWTYSPAHEIEEMHSIWKTNTLAAERNVYILSLEWIQIWIT